MQFYSINAFIQEKKMHKIHNSKIAVNFHMCKNKNFQNAVIVRIIIKGLCD